MKERRTSVDEWPGTDVHGTPGTAPLCKVPPVPVPVAQQVLSGLLAVVQSVAGAGRARVCGCEELMDRIAVSRLGSR